MDWQQVVSLTIVSATAVLLLRGRFRPRKFSFQRVTQCGNCSHGNSTPHHSITFRARKGERAQIVIKPK